MNWKIIIIAINVVGLLAFTNFSIFQKEQTLEKGQLVLLDLRPADPRSLMQGDYMNLRYAIMNDIDAQEIPTRGFVVVTLDSNNVAALVRTQKLAQPLFDGEHAIKYYAQDWDVSIGAESYFFQEGHAERFDVARYGALKVDKSGESVLFGLYDEGFRHIQP